MKDNQPFDNGKCNWQCDPLPLNLYKILNNHCENSRSKVSQCYKATNGDKKGNQKVLYITLSAASIFFEKNYLQNILFILLFHLVPVCPVGFPNLDKYTHLKDHGDVCRNDKIHGVNIGWTCPIGCIVNAFKAPWCMMSSNDNAPCRTNNF